MRPTLRALPLAAGCLTMLALAPNLRAQQDLRLRPGQQPGPRFMVPVLRSNESALGLRAAGMIRDRLGDDFLLQRLWIVPKNEIDQALLQSGYPIDRAIGESEEKALASLLRAAHYLSGEVKSTNGGFAFEGSMLLPRGDGMAQPFPALSDAKLDGLAKKISAEIERMRRALDGVDNCMMQWRQEKFAEALREAQRALAAHPTNVMARVCILEIYNTQELGADSIIRIAEEILDISAENRRALTLVADAYATKGLGDHYIGALKALVKGEPGNVRLLEMLAVELARLDRMIEAKPYADTAALLHPSSPAILKLQWRIYFALRLYREGAAIGEELAKIDSTATDTTFFVRMAAAYLTDSQPARARDVARRGATRFSDLASMWMLYAQIARQTGEARTALDALRKALSIDPRVEMGYLQLAMTHSDVGDPDSAFAAIRLALAHGTERSAAGALALNVANTHYYQKCSETKDVATCEAAIGPLAFADSLSPSVHAKLTRGVAHMLVAQGTLVANATARGCEATRTALAHIAEANIHVVQGAPGAGGRAPELLAALSSLETNATQQSQAFCKRQ